MKCLTYKVVVVVLVREYLYDCCLSLVEGSSELRRDSLVLLPRVCNDSVLLPRVCIDFGQNLNIGFISNIFHFDLCRIVVLVWFSVYKYLKVLLFMIVTWFLVS